MDVGVLGSSAQPDAVNEPLAPTTVSRWPIGLALATVTVVQPSFGLPSPGPLLSPYTQTWSLPVGALTVSEYPCWSPNGGKSAATSGREMLATPSDASLPLT